MSSQTNGSDDQVDVLLIGAGIMGATIAVLMKELDPKLRIELFEFGTQKDQMLGTRQSSRDMVLGSRR